MRRVLASLELAVHADTTHVSSHDHSESTDRSRTHTHEGEVIVFALRSLPHEKDFVVGIFGRGTDPRGSGTAVGFIWDASRGLATILDPFRGIWVILGPSTI